MSFLILPALFGLAPSELPGPVVKLPAEVSAPVGRVVLLKADTPGKVVRWVTAADGVDLVPFPDGKSAVFCSPTAGRFTVFAWTAAGDVPGDAARCVVVVGGPAPVPAGTFAAELKALVIAEPAGKGLVPALAAAYRDAAKLPDRVDVVTAGDLAGRVRGVVLAAVGPDALPGVRARIAAEVTKRLPADPDTPLDAATRKAAAELFADIATHLEAAR